MAQSTGKRSSPEGRLFERVDPLTDDQVETLLPYVDVVRDPLHGDIRLNLLERHVIGSPEFLRLRGIAQLGLSSEVYPGAVHTRSLHSLGTLHVSGQMIAICNSNASTYGRLAPAGHPRPVRITPYQTLLARFCALVHDMAHVPFGHTLEKEGRIFLEDEWRDEFRTDKKLFGDDTPFAERLRTFFAKQGLPASAADGLRRDARAVLSTAGDDVLALPYPFIHDLVGNTICADLLDYVRRDMFFCGLRETYGDRFLEYIAVLPVRAPHEEPPKTKPARSAEPPPSLVPVLTDPGAAAFPTRPGPGKSTESCRVALLQYRYNERNEAVGKHGVVGEAVDLIRRRFALAEKVYFHRTKVIASAMLISAAYKAGITPRELWDMSDSETLRFLKESKSPRASTLAAKLRERRFFKPIYHVSHHEEDGSRPRAEVDRAYERFKDPATREELAGRLERCIALEFAKSAAQTIGTVVVYCPHRDMSLKEFDMLVLTEPMAGRIGRLGDTNHPPTRLEIEAIHRLHKHLWRLEVFVDPEVVPLEHKANCQRLAAAIESEIGPRNELEGFSPARRLSLQEWERELDTMSLLSELGVADQIKRVDFPQILGVSANVRDGNRDELREAIRALLSDLGYNPRKPE